MICEAQFLGGPANGETRAFPGDEPPPTVEFDTVTRNGPGHSLLIAKVAYVRQVSQLDDGPLWVYVPKE